MGIPTIESIKEKAGDLFQEIEDFLTWADSNPQEVDDDTHDELVTIQDAIVEFTGEIDGGDDE